MEDDIYIVTTEGDVEGRSTRIVGYAQGDIKDIEDYFQDEKTYSLTIKPIVVFVIDGESAKEKRSLKKQIEETKAELTRLEKN